MTQGRRHFEETGGLSITIQFDIHVDLGMFQSIFFSSAFMQMNLYYEAWIDLQYVNIIFV